MPLRPQQRRPFKSHTHTHTHTNIIPRCSRFASVSLKEELVKIVHDIPQFVWCLRQYDFLSNYSVLHVLYAVNPLKMLWRCSTFYYPFFALFTCHVCGHGCLLHYYIKSRNTPYCPDTRFPINHAYYCN